MTVQRRLAAIVCTDVVGYSRLVGADETGTLARLKAVQREIIDPRITEFGGRIVKVMGDGLLLEFASVVQAVQCVIDLQAAMATRNANQATDRRIDLRIGVHLGDIVVDGDDILGDGVNVAARLETLAEPGAICLSQAAHDGVRGKIDAQFQDIGEQRLKNIAQPIRVFRLGVGSASTSTPPALALPDKPSIAVLPFENMSGDPEQEYFVDGMVEDIITELSRFQRLFVIARNTSFTYRGRSVGVKQVARELGVHFVLEGSVRKAGNRVRITAQLIDGETGRHVWAERYEDVLSDVFELQERITGQVVGTMVAEIEEEEMRLLERGQRRFTEAEDIAWRALKAMTDGTHNGQPALVLEAIRLAEQATERDRNCRRAWFVLGWSHGVRVFIGWTQDRAGSLEAGRQAAEMLMSLAPSDSRSYFLRAVLGLWSGDPARGLADLRRAHELNPNDTLVLFFLSWNEAAAGNVERANELAAQALRMSPKDRWTGVAHLAYALAAFIEQDFGRLREWAELAIQSQPNAPIRRVLMIAYAAEVRDTALLRTHLEKLQNVAPDFIPSLSRGDYRPFHRPEHMAMLLDSLRKAELAGPN